MFHHEGRERMNTPDPKLRALLDLRRGTSLIARFSQGALCALIGWQTRCSIGEFATWKRNNNCFFVLCVLCA